VPRRRPVLSSLRVKPERRRLHLLMCIDEHCGRFSQPRMQIAHVALGS